MRARGLLVLPVGVALALLLSTAPVCADHLASSSSAAGGFEVPDVQEPSETTIDPSLALALIFAVPAGTAATDEATSSTVQSPGRDSSNGSSDNGGSDAGGTGHTASVSPEPATLVTALIGAGIAGYAALRRRKKSAEVS